MSKEDYFQDWLEVIDGVELNHAVNTINYLMTYQHIVPEYKNIFKAFTLCKLKDCNVVMLGQDPYPQQGVATGVLFGNNKEPIAPSLRIIRDACIDPTMPNYNPKEFDITLESWGKQGILLLNSSLTCELGKPGSHTYVWKRFIKKLLHNLRNLGIIFVLFGREAQSFRDDIKGEKILEELHPAYYARLGERMSGKIFKDINEELKSRNLKCIKWYN